MDLKMGLILLSLAAFSQGLNLKCYVSDTPAGEIFNATAKYEEEYEQDEDVCIKTTLGTGLTRRYCATFESTYFHFDPYLQKEECIETKTGAVKYNVCVCST